ncbi:MAG: DUF4157 domain-containing protein [Anaerolineae bacterium]|nr:DUF4157 domain-containing protein [Anaerolineae bacterium]
MGNSGQISQATKKNQQKIQPPAAETPGNIANLTPEVGPTFNGPSAASQAEMLHRLPTAQGQNLAAKIGETQGNHHLQRVVTALKNRPLQTKLTVSEPGDEYETEADQVAEQVMKMPVSMTPPPVDGEGNNGEDPRDSNRPAALNRYVQRAPVQRSSDDGIGGNEVDSNVESRIQNMQHGGKPLPETERNFFESRMGVDLSNVNIHNDSEAAATSADLNAQAYTVGSDVAFGAGKYAPGTTAGRRLLAHELTHVVQQGGAGELKRQVEEKNEEQFAVEVAPSENQAGGSAEAGPSLNAEENAQAPDDATQMEDTKQTTGYSRQKFTNMGQKGHAIGDFETSRGSKGAHEKDDVKAQDHATSGEAAASRPEAANASESPADSTDTPTTEQKTQPEAAQDEAQAQAPQAQSETSGEAKPVSKETAAEKEEVAGESEAAAEEAASKETAAEEQTTADAASQSEAEPAEAAPPAGDGAQIDAALMQQTGAKLEQAQGRQEEIASAVEETQKEMDALDGADAIIPETLWKGLQLDQRRDEITSKESVAKPPQDLSSAISPDILIQRTPDPTVQRQPDNQQGTPGQISVPTITIDTAPITTAAANAIKAADFATKLTDLTTAVADARKRVNTLGPDTLKKLDDQLKTTLDSLEIDAVDIKLDIADRYNTANTTLDAMLPGLHQKAGDVVEIGCTKVDEVVQDYESKCDTDAAAAIQPYCDIQNNALDDGTSPFLGGPGEEKGYHKRKAKAAMKAALQVADAYKKEYRKQGNDTKSLFRSDILNEFYTLMGNEVAGMQTTLTTAKEDADKKVDETKEALAQQAKDLHLQSTTTLKTAITNTLADIDAYESKLITELTNAQSTFGTQVQTASDNAVADVNAALAAAQRALSDSIQSAVGPGQAFAPGAQAAVDQAAANIQAQLTQQITDAALQIAKQGTDMASTLGGIDVKAGSAAYADTFETTTNNMCTQVIDNGLVAINKNLIQYGTEVTNESDTRFQAYVTAASDGIKQIEDAGKTNLPTFVETEFKPGLEQAHGGLAAQAKAEGEKAGEAVQPLWKTILKAIIAIAIAIVIAVAIAAVVAATGGVAGVLLGVLVGAVLGGIGGAIKCVANSLIDTGQLPKQEDLVREVAMGALSGAISGLTAGLLGVAFQGTLSVGQMVLKEGIDAVVGAVKDAVVDACTQQWKNGKVDWGAVGGTFVQSLVINVVAAGIFKGPGIWKAYKAGPQGAGSAASSAANQIDDAANKIDDGVNQADDALKVGDDGIIRTADEIANQPKLVVGDDGIIRTADEIANQPKLIVGDDGIIRTADEIANSPKILGPNGQPVGTSLGTETFEGFEFKPNASGNLLVPTPNKFNGVSFVPSPTGSGMMVPKFPCNPGQNLKNAFSTPNWNRFSTTGSFGSSFNPQNWDLDAAAGKINPLNPFYNPVAKNASGDWTGSWGSQAWGKQTEKYVTKNIYKDLTSHSDYKGNPINYSDSNPGISDEANAWSDNFKQPYAPPSSTPAYQWNTQAPAAPGYNSNDWDFENGQAIPTIDTPDNPNINFNAGVDQTELEKNLVAP